jgi:hypothetical protein
MQLEILIGTWNGASSVANAFSICDAAEVDNETESDGSESPISNSHEHNSLTISGAIRHIVHSKNSSYAI